MADYGAMLLREADVLFVCVGGFWGVAQPTMMLPSRRHHLAVPESSPARG